MRPPLILNVCHFVQVRSPNTLPLERCSRSILQTRINAIALFQELGFKCAIA
ncbi:MAG: hypothetical protein AAF810_17755 [Cyanobacteria bacterium P01_D01_bin.36]